MIIEDIKKNLLDVNSETRSYVDNSLAYYKLKFFKVFMKGTTSFVKILLLAIILLPTIIILAITASIGIGYELGNMFYGFLIISGFFLLILIVAYLLRHKLEKILLKKISRYYFD